MAEVSIARCSSYEEDAVARAVGEAVAALGGIGRFASRGETILLKPNLLSPEPPEKAVTTHPEIVRAMIRLLKSAGATPIIGDTPAGRSSAKILTELAEATGMKKVCDEEGVEFALMLDEKRFPHPEGKLAKHFMLAAVLDGVDGVISLPKLKTHTFTVYTGAVKNCFGLIPGLKKPEYHLRMQDAKTFSEMLVDLAECVKPRLNVMDGVESMDGDGPSDGEVKNTGLILASESAHALDAVVLELVGARDCTVWTVERAKELGLVPRSPPFARVLGGDIEDFVTKDFKMPGEQGPSGKLLAWLYNIAGEGATRKPLFLASKCNLCESCIEGCPSKALVKGKRKPLIDRSLCIRCYCCQELCTQGAVKLRRMPLRSLGRTLAGSLVRPFLKNP